MQIRSNSLILSAVFVMACAVPLASFAQTSVETHTYSYNGKPLPIFRDDANVITLGYISVPRSTEIVNVAATVDIDYPKVGDLKVFLYSPEGSRVRLVEHDCGDKATLRRITFDDAAEKKYKDFCPAEPGWTMRPEDSLSEFEGENGVGLWVLAVENDESNDRTGWILGYSLKITGEVYSMPTTSSELVVNAASLQGGGIAPGELVSVYGVSLGPDTPVTADPGDLPTLLAGTEVSFNEQPGHIMYVSKYRIDVQVPYALGVPGDVWMTVKRGEQQTAPVNLMVVTAKPGIFTVNPSGIGQVEAINSDGTANKDEPARRGSEITVLASGLGYTLPPIPAGQAPVAKPTPATFFPVTASVAGIQAKVLDARLTLNRPGVYSVRIEIPESVPVGPVQLKISSVSESSQDGAYIRVR